MDEYPIVIAGMLAGKKYYCTLCGKKVTGFRDRLSAKDYRITGVYQQCQDKIYKEDNGED